MNKNVQRIQKKLGETPLEALNRLRFEHPEYEGLKMTYAGRLDPMAEGELLVLLGEECKNKDAYNNLDKEYEFEMLFGFKTDTYDLLGISTPYQDFNFSDIKSNLAENLNSFLGKRIQKYPPYSSKTVGGVPLFQKTKDGEEFELPEREVEVYEISFLGFREMKGSDLLEEIKRRISLVNGDFRQEEIVKKWEGNMQGREGEDFLIAKASMKCSSGTYVRSLVNELSYPATTFSIKRTKIF
ncbi:MAG: tRNA pseudouridine55 synthase [Patescibacteria group bacterium]|jgi:tRNA pseudouridine(55) synthase|nr:tRNA pseudouridine55 synthase [Patescibacteria group bacterium]